MDPISEIIWPYMLVFAVGLTVFGYVRQKMRTANLESTAKELGFEFSASGRSSTLSNYKNFKLFQKGQSQKTYHEMWRTHKENDISIFTFSYRENGGNKTSYRQTVISIKCSRLNAPTLSLQPKPKRLMMMPDFGQYDSDFEISPELSKNYVIKGCDEVKVREFFKPDVIRFFEASPNFYLETLEDTLIFYHSNHRTGYCDIKKLYAQGQELLLKLIY